MKDIIKKSFLLGLGAATLTKNQTEKIVKELVKKNAVTVKEGKDMVNKVKKAAKNESNRIKKFAGQEAKRVAGTVSGVSKIHLGKVQKRLKSIDKELSSKGKKTLKGIIKQLSK
jgi:polyhydroxyalkanoate synthesis regulator phasin|tara:strand:+ start:7567 stop:7908 length:342 start_codon:yes stop_codon:yes gene_type:complete